MAEDRVDLALRPAHRAGRPISGLPGPTLDQRRPGRLCPRSGLPARPDPPLRRGPSACAAEEIGRRERPRTVTLTNFVDRPAAGLVGDRERESAGSKWDEVGHAEI